jgi:hypothetical protein
MAKYGKENDLEMFQMQHPYVLQWVNVCVACHHKRYKPEMPEPEWHNTAYLPEKLRRLLDELPLDQDGLCEQCRKGRLLENS